MLRDKCVALSFLHGIWSGQNIKWYIYLLPGVSRSRRRSGVFSLKGEWPGVPRSRKGELAGVPRPLKGEGAGVPRPLKGEGAGVPKPTVSLPPTNSCIHYIAADQSKEDYSLFAATLQSYGTGAQPCLLVQTFTLHNHGLELISPMLSVQRVNQWSPAFSALL